MKNVKKKYIFINFHIISPYVCEWKVKVCRYFTCKNGKKSRKKHAKSGKSGNFQKALKSSIQLQITFWIAEKIAIECFNPNPKYEKIHKANVWEDEFLTSCMCFLAFLKKWKNTFLLVTFWKRVLWSWKHAQKKVVIGPDLHQKYYQNWLFFRKYTTFLDWFIFFSTPR